MKSHRSPTHFQHRTSRAHLSVTAEGHFRKITRHHRYKLNNFGHSRNFTPPFFRLSSYALFSSLRREDAPSLSLCKRISKKDSIYFSSKSFLFQEFAPVGD
ncbi:hypothetical protein CKAN_01451300 [Cinnamomum micranthum f. kanehirae]|uniref:Uncharacterized protein n=1 Tax=Cinnamomum micranthum f. kanehirae TaxID=337451 RepID=A0A443P4F2_9MAGN|nr:hypothetical protein CKAN_01451300 [Cinnamomum micranthum f. kanehirae]